LEPAHIYLQPAPALALWVSFDPGQVQGAAKASQLQESMTAMNINNLETMVRRILNGESVHETSDTMVKNGVLTLVDETGDFCRFIWDGHPGEDTTWVPTWPQCRSACSRHCRKRMIYQRTPPSYWP